MLDRQSEQLVARVPEEPLGLGIDELHRPVLADDHDCVGSRLDEPAEALLAPPEDALRTLALGHVADELLDHARDGVDGEACLAAGGAAHGFEDLRRRGAFDDVAHRPGRQHLDHGRLVVVGGKGKSPRRRRAILDSANDLGSTAGHAHVDEGDVRLRGRGELDRLVRAPCRADDLHAVLTGDEVAQGQAQRLLVVRDEDAQHRSFSGCSPQGVLLAGGGLCLVALVAERRASAGNPITLFEPKDYRRQYRLQRIDM